VEKEVWDREPDKTENFNQFLEGDPDHSQSDKLLYSSSHQTKEKKIPTTMDTNSDLTPEKKLEDGREEKKKVKRLSPRFKPQAQRLGQPQKSESNF